MSLAPPSPFFPFSNDITAAAAAGGDQEESHTSPFQNLKPSILITILILSITLLVSLSLCLLLRLLNRRCLRHLSPSSSSTTTTVTTTINRHSGSHRVSPEDFPSSLLDSLPLFTFNSIKRRSSTISAADCAVCLSKFKPQDLLRLLPLCCHAFHAECIDTWLISNQTCPLCRSSIHATESDILKALSSTAATGESRGDSFRLEIGSISRRQTPPESTVPTETLNSYSVGSFEYIVDDESEITTSQTHRRSVSDKDYGAVPVMTTQPVLHEPSLAAEVASGRSWLKDYVDRLSVSLSSRSTSFRGSGRFFTGSSRRSEMAVMGDNYDVEANRVGEEISEMFRWFSGL